MFLLEFDSVLIILGYFPRHLVTLSKVEIQVFFYLWKNFLDNHYNKRFLIKGTPEHVQAILEEEQQLLGIDELMIYAPIFGEQERLNSYKHLAKMFGKI